jgi:hypothetical protein
MHNSFTERDWKYMRSLKDELLHALCERINRQAVVIVESEKGDPHERYAKLYEHVLASGKIVAKCFDEWRRSKLWMKVLALRNHGLLSEEQIQNLSESARECLARIPAE